MSKFVKRASVLAMTLALAISMGSTALAAPRSIPMRRLAAPVVADPNADVIIWKYRVNNGVAEKRRWNVTKGVWVDPAWIVVDP